MASEKNEKEESSEELEKEHFMKVVSAFLHYEKFSNLRIEKAKKDFLSLDAKDRARLPQFLENLEKQKQCVAKNFEFVKQIIGHTGYIFENVNHHADMNTNASDQNISVLFMEKVVTTVKQFVRDWSDEGVEEREMCYKPIVDEIRSLYPAENYKPSDVSILVPGAGLARLMVDLAAFGYTIQGNEWSLFMLIASNYILNKCHGVYHTTIYPFVHQSCNNMSPKDQLRPVQIPDIDPTLLPPNINFSMNAGNFIEVYDERNKWDCVATCFFIDTANNIMSYIETIYKILKPGGYWVNLGPLLYHFADVANESSIEISYKELKTLVTDEFKFELLKEDMLKSTYIGNKKSMLETVYNCIFFVARKPL